MSKGVYPGEIQIGISGPQLKQNVSALEVRNTADSAYAVARGAAPVGPDDFVTLASLTAASLKVGAAVLDFGLAPTVTQRAVTTVVGQAAIVAGSTVKAFLVAKDTATHNAYEHEMVQLSITCGNIVPGVGFDITATGEWLLNGTFNVRWEWI